MSAAAAPVKFRREQESLEVLLQLTLNPTGEAYAYVASLNDEQRKELLELADSHHVVLRALQPVRQQAQVIGNNELAQWATEAIAAEHERIENALKYLYSICTELEQSGAPVCVMKSLDHTPDLGNDLDLYSTASERQVVEVMTRRFNAHVEARSWGDRLANKWNFAVPGLRESVEVHVQRLGQTGEHTALARRFVTRRMPKQMNGYTFMVPAAEERVIVCTLQRMYRHFYFRVCDIVNTANLIESRAIDYNELRTASLLGGIWPGVATLLNVVSDYVKRYRGTPLELPQLVTSAALFGAERIHARARFLRVPVMPEGAQLYTRQVTNAALRGDVPATFRLTLLPPLASAAAIAYKITGSDKGIW
jgi:hypothetical protein